MPVPAESGPTPAHTPDDGAAYVGAVLGAVIGAPLGAMALAALLVGTGAGGTAVAIAVAPGGGLIGLYLGGLIGFAIRTAE